MLRFKQQNGRSTHCGRQQGCASGFAPPAAALDSGSNAGFNPRRDIVRMLRDCPQAGAPGSGKEQAQRSVSSGASVETPVPPPPEQQQGSAPESGDGSSNPAPCAPAAAASGQEGGGVPQQTQGPAPGTKDSAEGKGGAISYPVLKSVSTHQANPNGKGWGAAAPAPAVSPFSFLQP